MAEVRSGASGEGSSEKVARAVWGLLMIWTGAVLLVGWGWGVGLLGAGAILLGAQAVRRRLRLEVDGLGLVAGALLVIWGAGGLFEVAFDLFPILCIVAGLAILASAWSAKARRASRGPADVQAPSHPRA